MLLSYSGILLVGISCVVALDNGLILKPPMGWLHWQRFRCQTDCKNFPDECISENLFMAMADHIVSDGYKDAGYEYVMIDDCWLDTSRDPVTHKLRPAPDRFPHGIKALADYIHGKGLKFGIYADVGTTTCERYPGSLYFMQLDAQTFAEWTVDFLKLDACYLDIHTFNDGYPPMALFLNMTGRPIVLCTAYSKYQRSSGIKADFKALVAAVNIDRNYEDIDDSWDSLKDIIEYYGGQTLDLASYAGPGYYNDPDELIIGNFGLSPDQERTQMAIWSILAGPLVMSVDLRTIRPESRALLQNKGAIAINQDKMGMMGKRVTKAGNIEIWTRPIQPTGSYAFVLLNLNTAVPSQVTVVFATDLLLNNANGYNVTEVFDSKPIGVFKPKDQFSTMVDPTGVFFGKAIAL